MIPNYLCQGVRRIKTEFLLQFEGMTTASAERIVVVAATNRPQVEDIEVLLSDECITMFAGAG